MSNENSEDYDHQEYYKKIKNEENSKNNSIEQWRFENINEIRKNKKKIVKKIENHTKNNRINRDTHSKLRDANQRNKNRTYWYKQLIRCH
jgi:hypothetical protein